MNDHDWQLRNGPYLLLYTRQQTFVRYYLEYRRNPFAEEVVYVLFQRIHTNKRINNYNGNNKQLTGAFSCLKVDFVHFDAAVINTGINTITWYSYLHQIGSHKPCYMIFFILLLRVC